MKNIRWKRYALWIVGVELVGAVSGLLNRNGMERYAEEITKPRLSPPEWLFPIAWSILYALMGIGAARIYSKPSSHSRTTSLWLFGIQLAFNFVWSFLFFGAQAFGFAFLIILLSMKVKFNDNFLKFLNLHSFFYLSFTKISNDTSL